MKRRLPLAVVGNRMAEERHRKVVVATATAAVMLQTNQPPRLTSRKLAVRAHTAERSRDEQASIEAAAAVQIWEVQRVHMEHCCLCPPTPLPIVV